MRHPFKSEQTKSNSLRNLTPGRSKPHSEETKRKMSESLKLYWKKRSEQEEKGSV